MAAPEEDPPAGVPEWVLTYGDLMSLLLCFFVLIASFSQMKTEEKKNAIIRSILKQFGQPESLSRFDISSQMNRTRSERGQSAVPLNDSNNPRKHATRSARTATPGDSDRVRILQEGKRQIVGGPALFERGSADLTPEAKDALEQATRGLAGKWHIVDVQGFESTEPLPLASKFADPIDLAYARTRAVVDYLASSCGIPRELIRASIAAPLDAAPTDAEKADGMSERVVITTLESTLREYERGDAP